MNAIENGNVGLPKSLGQMVYIHENLGMTYDPPVPAVCLDIFGNQWLEVNADSDTPRTFARYFISKWEPANITYEVKEDAPLKRAVLIDHISSTVAHYKLEPPLDDVEYVLVMYGILSIGQSRTARVYACAFDSSIDRDRALLHQGFYEGPAEILQVLGYSLLDEEYYKTFNYVFRERNE